MQSKKRRYTLWKFSPFLIALGLILANCGGGEQQETSTSAASEPTSSTMETVAEKDPMLNKGIGPVTSVTLGPLDEAMAAEGKEIFENMCTACHKMDKRYIGPALQEVTSQRSPEWIMNMIMNPTQMVQEDPDARELLKEYISPMADQNISEEQSRKILEYLRSVNPNENN